MPPLGDMVRTLVTAVAYDEFVAGKARKSSHEKAKSCGVLDLLAKRLTQADEDMTALQANDGGKMFGARIAATGPRRFDAALRTIFCQEQEKLAEEKRQQQEQQRRARWASGGYGAKHGDIKRKSGFGQSANIDTKSRSSEVEGSGCADGLNVMTIHQVCILLELHVNRNLLHVLFHILTSTNTRCMVSSCLGERIGMGSRFCNPRERGLPPTL